MPSIRGLLFLNPASGVRFPDVAALESAATEAGLQVGDVIEEVNRKPAHTMAEFQSQMSARGSDPVLLLVNHEGRTAFVAVHP